MNYTNSFIFFIFLLSSCVSFRQKSFLKFHSRGDFILNSSRSCRSWRSLKQNKDLFEKSNILHLDKSFLSNADFELHEIVDSGSFRTSIHLLDNGDMILQSNNGPEIQDFRGSWSVYNGLLRMLMERTYQGIYTQYTIQSYYLGVAEDDLALTDNLIIEGQICDELSDPDREMCLGKFFMISDYTLHSRAASLMSASTKSAQQKNNKNHDQSSSLQMN